MPKRIYVLIFFVVGIVPIILGQKVQSPIDFLSTNYGEEFSFHHEIIDYMYHVDEQSDQVKVLEYGRTYQKRPLILVLVSTAENLERLEEIRVNHLVGCGMQEGEWNEDLDRAIVWLSYTVHGDEAAGTECSPEVLYTLVDKNNDTVQEWLKNTIVIIDPCQNPDGYARYTNWIRDVQGQDIHPEETDIEHQEPWPKGRYNHYLFDLNRDWAWLTQTESRQRVSKYQEWLPHIHADVHEQGFNDNYFFAPSAKPFHKCIAPWQRSFQEKIGRNHARYFDEQGWLYFTKEIYDMFYPSYGDTYPTFSGAIGMTYEQAGIGAGRAIRTDAGRLLTLRDRIDHHRTTSLSTIQVGSIESRELGYMQRKYFDPDASSYPKKSYVIRFSPVTMHKLSSFLELLDAHHIRYGRPSQTSRVEAWSYQKGENISLELSPEDLIVTTDQPKGVLARVLLDYEHDIEDSLSYDITAWTLPLAYGLDAYSVNGILSTDEWRKTPDIVSEPPSDDNDPVAWILPRNSMRSISILSKLWREDIQVRVFKKSFSVDNGNSYPSGTFVLTVADNEGDGSSERDLVDRLSECLSAEDFSDLRPLYTGWMAEGPDLGSEEIVPVQTPDVLLIGGEGTDPSAFGQVRYMFEQEMYYPITITDKTRYIDVLDDYDVLILPDGYYSLSMNELETIHSWVASGGRLIIVGYPNRHFARSTLYGLSSWEKNDSMDLSARYRRYECQHRVAISEEVTGAIIENVVDSTHPLGYGYGSQYFSLKTSDLIFPLLNDGWNVVRTPKEHMRTIGFVGSKIGQLLSDRLTFGVEEIGHGYVVYMVDNPLYRMFWQNGKLLFANAIFMVD